VLVLRENISTLRGCVMNCGIVETWWTYWSTIGGGAIPLRIGEGVDLPVGGELFLPGFGRE
jgi:hypothetical protein